MLFRVSLLALLAIGFGSASRGRAAAPRVGPTLELRFDDEGGERRVRKRDKGSEHDLAALDAVRGSFEAWVRLDGEGPTRGSLLRWEFDEGSQTGLVVEGTSDLDFQVKWRSRLFRDSPMQNSVAGGPGVAFRKQKKRDKKNARKEKQPERKKEDKQKRARAGRKGRGAITDAKPAGAKDTRPAPPVAQTPAAKAGRTWHHVAVTWSSTRVRVFVDGVSGQARSQPSRQDVGTGAGRLRVGIGAKGAFVVDDVRVYDWALSDKDVRARAKRRGLRAATRPAARAPSLRAEWGPSERKAVIYLDVAGTTGAKSARLALVDEATGRRRPLDGIPRFPGELGEALVPLPALAATTYHLRAEVLDAAGKVIARPRSATYSPPAADYLHNTLGENSGVPAPFLPVTFVGDAIEVFGRDTTLAKSGLPRQITSAGEDLLAAPVRLVGRVGGRPVAWRAGALQKGSATPERAQWKGEQRGAGLRVKTDGSVEYDGLMRFDVTVEPEGKGVLLDGLDLEIRLPAARARYWYGWSCGWKQYKNLGALDDDQTGSLVTAADVHHEIVRGDFVPYFELMDEERTLAFLAVNDEGWVHAPGVPSLEVSRRTKGGPVTLVQRLIARPHRVDAPRTFTFFLMAGPEKPRPPGWRSWIVGLHERGPFRDVATKRVWWMWPDGEGRKGGTAYQPFPHDREASRARVSRLNKSGMSAVPFLNLSVLSGWSDKKAFNAELPATPDGWRIGNVRAAQDFTLTRLDEWRECCGIGGVYFDEPYVKLASYNLFHGAYIRDDGTRQAGFRWPLQREMLRRTWRYFHDVPGDPGLVWLHKTNHRNLATFSFIDIAMDGEWPAFWNQPKHNRSLFRFYRPDRMFAVTANRQTGAVPTSIAVVKVQDPRARLTAARSYLALMSAWDVDYSASLRPQSEISRANSAKARFGIGADDVRFVGWWQPSAVDNPVRSAPDDAYVSAWVRPGGTLLVVANAAGDPKRPGKPGRVSVRLQGAYARADVAAWDAETGIALKVGPRGALLVDVPEQDVRFVRLTPGGLRRRAPPATDGVFLHAPFARADDIIVSSPADDAAPSDAPPRLVRGGLAVVADAPVGFWTNPDPVAGTIAFRLTPGEDQSEVLRQSRGFPFDLKLGKGKQPGLTLSDARQGKARQGPRSARTTLRAGREHSVVLSWESGVLRMFVDGTEAGAVGAERDRPGTRGALGYHLTVGGRSKQGRRRTAGTGGGTTLRDLVIYDWAARAADAKRIARASGPVRRPPSSPPSIAHDVDPSTLAGTVRVDATRFSNHGALRHARATLVNTRAPGVALATGRASFYQRHATVELERSEGTTARKGPLALRVEFLDANGKRVGAVVTARVTR